MVNDAIFIDPDEYFDENEEDLIIPEKAFDVVNENFTIHEMIFLKYNFQESDLLKLIKIFNIPKKNQYLLDASRPDSGIDFIVVNEHLEFEAQIGVRYNPKVYSKEFINKILLQLQ